MLSSLPRHNLDDEDVARVDEATHTKLADELNVLKDRYSDEEKAKLAEDIVVNHAYYLFQFFRVFIRKKGDKKEEKQYFALYTDKTY